MIRNLLIDRTNWSGAAILGETSCTYRDLARQALAISEILAEKDDKNVAIFLPDGERFVAAMFGVFMAGKVAFPLNAGMTAHEILPLLAQADVHTVITDKKHGSKFGNFSAVLMEEIGQTEWNGPLYPVREAPAPQKTLLLLATSGTTGRAKLVEISEMNLDYCVHSYIDKMDYGKYETGTIRYLIATPYSSVYGLLILTVCLVKSFPVVTMSGGFSLPRFYQTVQDYKVTHSEGGTMTGILMEQTAGRPVPYDVSSLRYLGLAGSKIEEDVLKRLAAAYPRMEFWTGYGMTEASPLIAKPYKVMDARKLASVGTALPGEEIQIFADGVLTARPHVMGEIVVKGPNVMLGYYRNEEATREIVQGGRLYTGDIGYLDEEGYLYICGRVKNVIIVRGFNVYPEEVESCLRSSGLVRECVVYGENAKGESENVCADVVARNESVRAETLRAYCAEHLSAYKVPQKISLVETLERTATGKVKRGK